MKINKRILLAGLFVSGIANSQEFYTCVPKKDWWKNTMKESIKEQKKEEWKLIINSLLHLNKSFSDILARDLGIGVYKIRLLKNNELIAEKIIFLPSNCDFFLQTVTYKCDGSEYKTEFNDSIKRFNFKDSIFLQGDSGLLESCDQSNNGELITVSSLYFFYGDVLFTSVIYDDNLKDIVLENMTMEVWKKLGD